MLKAIILKVERNANDPQVNLEVSYVDDEMSPEFQLTQVLTLPTDNATEETVRNIVEGKLKELDAGLKATIQKEQELRDIFQGMEIQLNG